MWTCLLPPTHGLTPCVPQYMNAVNNSASASFPLLAQIIICLCRNKHRFRYMCVDLRCYIGYEKTGLICFNAIHLCRNHDWNRRSKKNTRAGVVHLILLISIMCVFETYAVALSIFLRFNPITHGKIGDGVFYLFFLQGNNWNISISV